MIAKTLYHLLGQTSATFATIEHRLVSLLEFLLIDDNGSLVRSYLLDRMPLAQQLEKIQTIAKLRLWNHKSTFEDLKKIMKSIDQLRTERNIFIHGDWFVEDLEDVSDHVTVYNRKPILDEETGLWTCLNSIQVSRRMLNTLLKKATELLEKVSEIYQKICQLELR